MKCNRTGCTHDAKHQLGWRVWARDCPKNSVPLEAHFNLAVCDECAKGVNVEELIDESSKQTINDELIKNGRIAADFSTLELVLHPIIGDKLFTPPARDLKRPTEH